MIRAVILAATLATLFVMWRERPAPVNPVQTAYCVIDYKAGAKDPLGEWHTAWVKGYGPCSLQDVYRNI